LGGGCPPPHWLLSSHTGGGTEIGLFSFSFFRQFRYPPHFPLGFCLFFRRSIHRRVARRGSILPRETPSQIPEIRPLTFFPNILLPIKGLTDAVLLSFSLPRRDAFELPFLLPHLVFRNPVLGTLCSHPRSFPLFFSGHWRFTPLFGFSPLLSIFGERSSMWMTLPTSSWFHDKNKESPPVSNRIPSTLCLR